jgi:Kdo2-lipid IVA lauroyltransferase/acyltransferase
MTISLAHRAEYYALRGTVAGLQRLSWRRAGALGARIGALGYRPFGVRRRIVERQVAAAFPELPDSEVRRIARSAYEHLGRITIEAALLPTLGRERILELLESVDGWDAIERARSAGSGVILVTGHLGNWEMGAALIAARGVPVAGIARRMNNPLFDRYLTDTRRAFGAEVIHDADAVRRAPRALRENKVVAFVSDQGVRGLASTYVPFFGRPAKTPRGPAVFALRFGIPVVFGIALRQPSGRYSLIFEPVEITNTGDRERDIDVIVAEYTRVLERWVRRAPEQYLWHHRRWRRQPPDTPPELREPT